MPAAPPKPTTLARPPQTSFAQPAAASDQGGGLKALYGRYAVPVAILMFALATESLVLPIIFFVLWLQRQKLLAQAQLPWEEPERMRPWISRFQTRSAASRSIIDRVLLKVLADAPYGDRAAFQAWVRLRIASAISLIFGAFFMLRLVGELIERIPTAATTTI